LIKSINVIKGFQTAESRWARFGPYYAMFPLDFAFEVIEKYSKEGDYIIDPFAGRGSSLYAGAVLGRRSLGIEINPVGWLYGAVKLYPADKDEVVDRVLEIYSKRNYYNNTIEKMPVFFRKCYCDEVLKFLLCARNNLNWENNNIDATFMSIILVYLHGKLGEALSNQMRMTKAMGINYSIRWWKKNKLTKPPLINPCEFLLKKINWRYEKGVPTVSNSMVICGDCSIELDDVIKLTNEFDFKFSLLFTSPPYCSITDYHVDQWLRLWMLGGAPYPYSLSEKCKGRFVSKVDYYDLLDVVFEKCSQLMHEKSIIYVRTDARKYTLNTTLEVLKKHFSSYNVKIVPRPVKKRTQTQIFGNKSMKRCEIDIILKRS